MSRLILTFAALALTGSALADEPMGFDRLSACRIDAAQAQISFAFQGSPCIAAEAAEVTAADDGSLVVKVPFAATSEVCTMNIVPVELVQAIGVEAKTSRLSVSAVDKDGNIYAAGETGLASAPDCTDTSAS